MKNNLIFSVLFYLFLSPCIYSQETDTTKTKVINEVLFSVGTNLNFINTNQTSGLYYDINAFIPALDQKKGRFGIDARLNQGKLVPNIDTSGNRTKYFTTQSFENQDTIDVLKQVYSTTNAVNSSHITLSLSPTYRFGKQTFIYLAGHIEYRKIDRETELEFLIDEEVSLRLTEEDLDRSGFNISPINILNRNIKSKTVSHNFNGGLGAKLFLELGSATLNIKSIIGYGDKGENEGMFYLTHFEVIETKLGFKVGGELRGITNFKDSNRSTDFEPEIGLYIAKSFKLSKIKDILSL